MWGNSQRGRISATAAWLVFCAFCTGAGWILSAVHSLNAAGYAAAFAIGLAVLAVWLKISGATLFSVPRCAKMRRRFRHLCPLTFLTLATLAFLGGALYGPKNYDGLAYRLPRVLHWLAEGQWHWIRTSFQRVNTHAPGIEWVSAPIIAFTRGGRLLFLINVVSFCLMPGLLFAAFTRLGVQRRVAYAWMWLFPSGYCFLLQAGSIGNDLFVALFALAALSYGLRARTGGDPRDLWLSILAAGLMTGAKANSIPLLLVWLAVVAFSWKLWKQNLLKTAAVSAIALAVSFFPMAVLNWKNCGDWTGARAEQLHFTGTDLAGRMFGNSVMTVINNFAPPVAPFAGRWNSQIAPRLVPAGLRDAVARDFDTQGSLFSIEEIQIEEAAGLGFGVSVLLGISFFAALLVSLAKRPEDRTSQTAAIRWMQWAVFGAMAISVLAVMKLGIAKSTPRMLAPYYALLVALFLLPRGHGRIIRRRWWSWAVIAVWMVAAMLLIINPSRPLFPAQTMVRLLHERGWGGPLFVRAEKVYSIYAGRADAFGPVLKVLPADATVLGLVTYDDPEACLWWPFGSRRVVHVCPEDTPETLNREGVHYILLSPEKLPRVSSQPLEKWLAQFNAEVIREIPLALRAGSDEVTWLLVRLRPPDARSADGERSVL